MIKLKIFWFQMGEKRNIHQSGESHAPQTKRVQGSIAILSEAREGEVYVLD
jgi:hypothetical protein